MSCGAIFNVRESLREWRRVIKCLKQAEEGGSIGQWCHDNEWDDTVRENVTVTFSNCSDAVIAKLMCAGCP
jgi:hypothetical protein